MLYIVVMLATVVCKSAFLWPNFFGAKIFEKEGWEWTPRFMKYTVYLWMFLVLVAPILNYWVIIGRMHTITLVIHETPHGRVIKNYGMLLLITVCEHLNVIGIVHFVGPRTCEAHRGDLGLIDSPEMKTDNNAKEGVDV